MSKLALLILSLFSVIVLSACHTTGSTVTNSPAGSAPALSPNSRPTSRIPSPGSIGRTNLMQSNTMMPPSAY